MLKFLKRIIDSSSETEEKAKKKLKFHELRNWINNKKEELEDKEAEFLKQANSRISQLAKELEREVKTLEGVNVGEKGTEERIKAIVKSNLDNYIDHLQRLVVNLKDHKLNSGKTLTGVVVPLINKFGRDSSMSIRKASFLIGKEFEGVGLSIKGFLEDLKELEKNNEGTITTLKVISSIELNLEEINALERTEAEFKENIKSFEQEIKELEGRVKDKNSMIKEIKKSESYRKEKNRKEKFDRDKKDLTKKINDLKERIDFKHLANILHSDSKKMGFIKEYKNNFEVAFQKDDGARIIKLLGEAKVDPSFITQSIDEIARVRKEIDDVSLKKDEVEEVNIEIKMINSQIENLNSKIDAEQKKCGKFGKAKVSLRTPFQKSCWQPIRFFRSRKRSISYSGR